MTELLSLFMAQVPPGPVIDPNQAVSGVIDSVAAGSLALLIGFGVMTLTWIGQKIFAKLSENPENTSWLRWFACALAALGAFSVALVQEPTSWINAVAAAALAWFTAMGQYEALKGGKQLLFRKVAKAA